MKAAESRIIPDRLIRAGIRRQLKHRLAGFPPTPEARAAAEAQLVEELKQSPVALSTREANEQHYEVPSEFFMEALGPHMKYSCALFPTGAESLEEAEALMLGLTCDRAKIEDGCDILELGCGWGSLTLWMAEHYPASRITAVSNSHSQKEYIMARAHERGLKNISIITADMNHFQAEGQYDRVVSIEMFEHMRNYQELIGRIANWMKPGGYMFIHIFTHQNHSYTFDTGKDDGNWMANYFFTDGIMPSDTLLTHFQDDLSLVNQWVVDGMHYSLTAEAWLQNMDANHVRVQELFQTVYGPESRTWVQRWRMFFMACAELWGYQNGHEWHVCHYLFQKTS
jgi:cyclopropane-fatty-acyl-phospholipid synthase